MGSGLKQFLPSCQPALDHFHASASSTSFRRKGLAWMYSIIKQNEARVGHVAIEAAAGLPKTTLGLGALLHRDAWQPQRRMLTQMFDRTHTHRLLDRLENAADVVLRLLRPNQNVDVFRHEDICPQQEIMFAASVTDGFGQPFANTLGLEKGIVAIARESQLMGMPRVIDRRPTQAQRLGSL